MKTVQMNCRVPPAVREWIKQEAAKDDREPGYFLAKLIEPLMVKSVRALDKPQPKSAAFKMPVPQAVHQYMVDRGMDWNTASQESEKFHDFYSAKGWMVGKNKMKDWKAAVRNWMKGKSNEKGSRNSSQSDKQSVLDATFGRCENTEDWIPAQRES